jgi:hypothetical protein
MTEDNNFNVVEIVGEVSAMVTAFSINKIEISLVCGDM